MTHSKPKKIVIVGGGFGGIYVAGGLKKVTRREQARVTLISPQNYFLFTPLLHEVATGSLSPTSVAEPVREIFRKDKINFIQSKVDSIDSTKQIVLAGGQEVSYDILVVSTGAETNFYDILGAEKYSLPLKTLHDSVIIRSRIIDAFEQAALTSDQKLREELLTFVIVGGGATGVELSGEIAEFVFKTLSFYYRHTFCRINDIKVILISSTDEVLNLFPKTIRLWSEKELLKNGVVVKNETYVTEVKEREIILNNGEQIRTQTVLWTAGVKSKLPEITGNIEKHESGRVLVDEFLRAKNFENIFILGDTSASQDEKEELLPMFAQVAVSQSKTVVKNIKAIINKEPLQKFSFRHKGFLVSIGQWRAVGVIFGFRLQGRFAWWIWRTVYLFKFISWRKKMRIAFEWTINLFYPRDTTKIS